MSKRENEREKEKDKRVYSNSIGFLSYILETPGLLDKFRSKLVLAVSIAVFDYLLYRQSFRSSNATKDKFNVYGQSAMSYLKRIPPELIDKAIRKLVKLKLINREMGGRLTICPKVLLYFYRVTGNETYYIDDNVNTSEKNETIETAETEKIWKKEEKDILSLESKMKVLPAIKLLRYLRAMKYDLRDRRLVRPMLRDIVDKLIRHETYLDIDDVISDVSTFLGFFGHEMFGMSIELESMLKEAYKKAVPQGKGSG